MVKDECVIAVTIEMGKDSGGEGEGQGSKEM